MKKKRDLLLGIFGVVGLIVITVGVSYAFFNYSKLGTKENTVTTSTITFLYTEVDKVGAGIEIEDAMPMSDDVGKAQIGSGSVFNFKITSTAIGSVDIPYEITARKKDTSDLADAAVKLYLTEVNGESEKELVLNNYDKLADTEKSIPDGITEKTLLTGTIPTGARDYERNFRLRMWIDTAVDYSTGDYNGKSFTVTVNVYANAKTVTEAEIDMANTTAIETLTVNDTAITAVDGQDYDYSLDVDYQVPTVDIDVVTKNEEATVEVTKLDSLANNIKESSVQKMSTTKKVTFDVGYGDNYFKIKVISVNKQVENEYVLKITKRQYALDNQTYTAGSAVTWAGLSWYVIEDNGDSVDLILASNYATGAYGSSTAFSSSTAKTQVNTNFVNSNSIVKSAIDEGSVVYDSASDSYVRLPSSSELSSNIRNSSGTLFWTMSSNGSSMYVGSSSGTRAVSYSSGGTSYYYSGYGSSLSSIRSSGTSSVSSTTLYVSPSSASVSYNHTYSTRSRPTSYSTQTNITAANAQNYGCSGNVSCPNSYCGAKTGTYYTSTCSIGSFTYYGLQNWYNPTYNVISYGSSCGSNTIYYASGSCSTFYSLSSTSSNIGYRPVLTVVKR